MGYNQITILGNLGKDVEVREVNSETKVLNMTVAVTEKWRDKDGNDKERTDWFTVDYFTKSDALAQYLKKGTQVFVVGSMVSHDYEDKDGNKRTAWSVRVDRLQLLGGKKENASGDTRSNKVNFMRKN